MVWSPIRYTKPNRTWTVYVFERLLRENLKSDPNKCRLFQTEVGWGKRSVHKGEIGSGKVIVFESGSGCAWVSVITCGWSGSGVSQQICLHQGVKWSLEQMSWPIGCHREVDFRMVASILKLFFLTMKWLWLQKNTLVWEICKSYKLESHK